MSLHPNWVALATVEIPWKNFVKSSENGDTTTPSKSGNTYSTRRLNFKGIEAKKTYDEIVRQNYQSDITAKTKSGTAAAAAAAAEQMINKFHLNNCVAIKVSTNSILKAIEQNDISFLKKHLNSDNVNFSDDFGWTPLMSAAYNGNIKIVEYLLKLGVNKRAKEKSGLTAAQLALKKNHLSIVALLKRKHFSGDRNDDTDADADVGEKNLERRGDGVYLSTMNKKDEDEESISRVYENGTSFLNSNGAKKLSTNSNDDNKMEFYCQICDSKFKKSSVKQHESSTLHIFNTKPKIRSVGYGIAKQNKGYQMLLNTGWEEENGLGPLGDGVKYPVKTVLKRDRKGFGQNDDKEARVTHFKPGDVSAVNTIRNVRQKTLKKKDREKLLTREAMKDRMIRIALS